MMVTLHSRLSSLDINANELQRRSRILDARSLVAERIGTDMTPLGSFVMCLHQSIYPERASGAMPVYVSEQFHYTVMAAAAVTALVG